MSDFATRDLVLAILHHLLVFSFPAVIAAELVIIRPTISARDIPWLSRIDMAYGAIAAAIIIVGICRVAFAAKGWTYYEHNLFFWGKMAAFLCVGLLTIPPTLAIMRWKSLSKGDPAFAPSTGEVRRLRRYLWLEMAGLGLIVACAAAMARGYGSL